MADNTFASNTVVELLIPQAADLDIEEILQTADVENLATSIKQRDLLFFGIFPHIAD